MCQCFSLAGSGVDEGRRASGNAAESGSESEVSVERRETALDRAGNEPWIDVHAHPGRCFLHGLDGDDPFVRLLGAENLSPVLEEMREGGVRVACFATVSDLRVLGVDESGGIRAQRDFEPGEAYRDHRRQVEALIELRETHGLEAVLDLSDQPVMVSHSHLVTGSSSHPRLLTRDHACAVADAGGLIGAWPAGFAIAGFAEYIDEILRLADLVGVDHVAIGTDMDTNYRPVVSSYRQFPDIAATLVARGMSPGDAAKILGGNFLRLFEHVSCAA